MDQSWRKEYILLKNLTPYQKEVLQNGPKCLTQAWALGAMHNDWKSNYAQRTSDQG